jgi:predicted enzyme related to lactoylglutathione lyase
MACPVMHFEIGCKDQQKTQEFYGKLFDWKMHIEGPAAMIAAEPTGIGATSPRWASSEYWLIHAADLCCRGGCCGGLFEGN